MRLDLRTCAATAAMALLLALPGCNGEQKEPAKGTAGGEILEASVTDAMLPTDRVRSQPPLAPRTEGADGKDGRHSSAADDEQGDSADAAADSAPAEAQGAEAAPPAPATPAGE